MHRKVLVVFTVIDRATLEKSLNYLVCPTDQSELELDIESSDKISEGEYICQRCKTIYPIREGVPYFFEKGNGIEWEDDEDITESIASTISDRNLSWAKIISLGELFLNKTKDRRKSIDNVFEIVTDVIRTTDTDTETRAYLMQAATAARYEIENYRGTFTIPPLSLAFLRDDFQQQGIVVEGACATGECLAELTAILNSEFYMGLDLSGNLVRKAQKKGLPNTLYIQGDVRSLPIRRNSAGLYVLNNVFDRVVDPCQACLQANLVVNNEDGFLVLSNCNPLQYSYTTEDGRTILFVPENKQLSLSEGLILAGFREQWDDNGVWQIQTSAYGKEALPYVSYVGRRQRK